MLSQSHVRGDVAGLSQTLDLGLVWAVTLAQNQGFVADQTVQGGAAQSARRIRVLVFGFQDF